MMKRVFLTLMLLIALSFGALAQTGPGTIQPPAAVRKFNAVAANGSFATPFNTRVYGAVKVSVTITGTAVVNFEGRMSSTQSFAARKAIRESDTTNTSITSASTSGDFIVYLAGDEEFNCRVSGFSSGTVTVYVRGIPSVGKAMPSTGGSGGGGGTGTVTNTGGDLTNNAVALGAGGADLKVDTGLNVSGTGATLDLTSGRGFSGQMATLTPAADLVPATFRAFSSGTNPIQQNQTSGNVLLSGFAHAGGVFFADGVGGAADTFIGRNAASGAVGIGTTAGGTNGALAVATVNKITITQPATGATLTIPDGVTLNAGAGGTLGSNAFNSTAFVPTSLTVNGKALSGNITLGLASADYANQGTTTTVLHGNAAGNPSFGQIVNADITNSTIDLAAKVTGLLPVANAGIGISLAGIAKGGMISGTGAGTLGITVVGTDGQVWTADAASTGGAKWAAGGGGLTVGTTAITSGTATRLLYETSGNLVGEISGVTSDGANLTLAGSSLTFSGNISAAGLFSTSGIRHKGVAATFTDTTSSGTVADARTNTFGGNTLVASSATTITNYYTAYFSDATASTNVTLTNKWAIGGDSMKIGSNLLVPAVASGVDGLTITGAATANPATVSIVASGSDANINLSLSPKATGRVLIGPGSGDAQLYSVSGSPFQIGTISNNTIHFRTNDTGRWNITAAGFIDAGGGGGTVALNSGADPGAGPVYAFISSLTTGLSAPVANQVAVWNNGIKRLITGPPKTLTNNTATAIVNITDASNTIASGFVEYVVEVFDGTDLQVESGSFAYQVTNKGGTIANNTITFAGASGVGVTSNYPKNTVTSGTLACTWTITAANPAVLTLNANSSLTPSAGYPRVTYTIKNLTQQSISTL